MTPNTNTGTEFEDYVQQLLTLSGYRIERNVIVGGTQIDVVARSSNSLAPVTYLVECTDQGRNVPIDYVKQKAGALFDTGNEDEVAFLMIVSRHGFSAEAKAFAETRPRLILTTASDLEDRLIDFSPYRDWYTLNYRESTGMFNEARLFEHYVEISATDGHSPAKPLDNAVREWLNTTGNNVLFLLGDYGAGKTSFLRKFAFELLSSNGSDPDHSVGQSPVLVPLRGFRSAINLRQVITDTLVNDYGVSLPSFQAFERYCSLGKVLLLLDGFDEMANQSNLPTVIDCLTQIMLLAETNTKLIVTCRSNFFKSHYQLFEALRRFEIEIPDADGGSETLPLVEHGKVLTLSPLSPKQVQAFVKRRYPEKSNELLKQIKKIHDLSDLCKRPVLLDMVLSTLPDIHESDGVVNSAVLYETYTNRWAKRDQWRVRMSVDARQVLCDSLAWAMHARGLTAIAFPDLRKRLGAVLSGFSKSPEELEEFANDIQTCSFLVREGEGDEYQFAHKSFLEYFVARRLAKGLIEELDVHDDDSDMSLEDPGVSFENSWPALKTDPVLRTDSPFMSGPTLIELRDALGGRLRSAGGAVWFGSLHGDPASLGPNLERRVKEVFEVEDSGRGTGLAFELTPEIATFALEWFEMKRIPLGEVIEKARASGDIPILTDIIRQGTDTEYVSEHREALASALASESDPAFTAAAAAALVRSGHIDSAEALLKLRKQITLPAFNYVIFTIAEAAVPNRISMLIELDARGELDEFGSIVATYAQRNLLPEDKYNSAILAAIKASAGSSGDTGLALEMVASTLPPDDTLVDIVENVVLSDCDQAKKFEAIDLLESLSPNSHSKLRRIWTRVDDPTVRRRLQKKEERLRSMEATSRDRNRWKGARSMDTDRKLWMALSASV